MTAKTFEFREDVAYDDLRKEQFHHLARRQLKLLANALGLPPEQHYLRHNRAGVAVMWNVNLPGS